MDTYSLAAAARTLRTSAPRVRRAIDRLGMRVERADSGVFRLTQSQVDELASVLGRDAAGARFVADRGSRSRCAVAVAARSRFGA